MKTTLSIWAVSLLMGIFGIAVQARGAPPPAPDPHPSSCKKFKDKRKCKAKIDPRPYRVVITWRIEDEAGNISYAPGTCLRTSRGLVDCTITFRW